jgi:pyruvate/2-oxoglutarate dehydrogenase complex dihydrolipoamide dehydrogenase (E3) component
MEERYDLVVIGVGPAGEKGATQVAYFGKRVAVLERSEVPGGTPATTGAIPTKTIREAARLRSTAVGPAVERQENVSGCASRMSVDRPVGNDHCL